MLHFHNQSTEYDEKLPIEHPLREALSIYINRLKVFFVVVGINILLFLLFIAAQHLSVQFLYLLNINIVIALSLSFFALITFFYFAYQKVNPVKGYLIFSDSGKEFSKINLYTGWRITKKDFHREEPHLNRKIVLTARNSKSRHKRSFDEPRQIYIHLKDKSRNEVIFEGIIRDGDIISLPDGIDVSYRS